MAEVIIKRIIKNQYLPLPPAEYPCTAPQFFHRPARSPCRIRTRAPSNPPERSFRSGSFLIYSSNFRDGTIFTNFENGSIIRYFIIFTHLIT